MEGGVCSQRISENAQKILPFYFMHTKAELPRNLALLSIFSIPRYFHLNFQNISHCVYHSLSVNLTCLYKYAKIISKNIVQVELCSPSFIILSVFFSCMFILHMCIGLIKSFAIELLIPKST